jgi:cytochrome c biogenesis protein CcmG/thiol:disulfide interchange protein DsbE
MLGRTGLLFLVLVGAGGLALARASGNEEGALAPSLELKGEDGSTVKTTDLRGSVVLLDVWASWCGPCKSSFPALDSLYQEFHPEGLEVLAVNVDERPQDAARFLSGRKHQMTVILDPRGRVPEALGASGMPSSFLIDRRGVVRFRHEGFTPQTLESYRREIDILLGEKVELGTVVIGQE